MGCSRARLRLAGEGKAGGAAAQYCQSDDRDQRTDRAEKGSNELWGYSAPSEAAEEDPFGVWGDAALRCGEELRRPVTWTFWVCIVALFALFVYSHCFLHNIIPTIPRYQVKKKQ